MPAPIQYCWLWNSNDSMKASPSVTPGATCTLLYDSSFVSMRTRARRVQLNGDAQKAPSSHLGIWFRVSR